jgi:Uma2 family endonuclease
MTDLTEKHLTVDEFLLWAEGQEGKWELHDGAPAAMAPERIGHTETKGEAFVALRAAIRASGAPCRAYSEGVTVRIRGNRAFVPDALVVCPPPSRDEIAISDPLIVLEVLSPSTAVYDHGIKLQGYFSLPSLAHYLILDPDRRVVIHHARGREGVIETRILHDGRLRLDPPGLEVAVAELFGSVD